jgi:ketosteroid isomerase-like protein
VKKIHWLTLLVIIFLSGCGTGKGTAPKIDSSNMTPSQVVETYYNSIATGDYSTAKAVMSDDIGQQYINSPDSDFKNIKKLTDLKVSPAAPIKLNGKNFDEVQVTAEYVAEYKKVITSNSGKQIRFIYVAKKDKDSTWKIISIGTGP